MMRALLALWLCALVVFPALAGDAASAAPADPRAQILVLLQMPPQHFHPGSDYAGDYGAGAGHAARRRIAAQLARKHGLVLTDDWPVTSIGVDCYVLTLPAARRGDRNVVVQALAQDPRVAWAEPMNLYRAQGHDDPLYAVQPAATAWHLSALHALATGRQVRIALIDSGVEVTHPDLVGQIEASRNFIATRPLVAERHGTEVAGIIAARADNHQGIVGIAPDARLLALRACWQDAAAVTLCNSLSLARALDFAIAEDVQVINLSLSGPPDLLLGRLLDAARARGIGLVAAADRSLPDGGFPASHPGVIAVADDAPGGAAAGVLLAPGRDVPTTGPPSRWYLVSGSSYAAAHVSGLLALVVELDRAHGHRPASVSLQAVKRDATGAVDACGTLSIDRDVCPCACADLQAAAPLGLR